MSSQQPKVLRPSWETIPSIFSTIKSYTSAVEWFYYLTYISHMMCKSESAHIAKANLIGLLRTRPTIQMWQEALLSEMYDEDEPNLPSMLEGSNFLNPSVQRFHEYTTQRFELMTNLDVFVARCVVVDFIYKSLDNAQMESDRARDGKQKEMLEEQGRLVREQQKARKLSQAEHLRFGSPKKDTPPVGQIGVNDLAALLAVISLHFPPELPVLVEPMSITVPSPKRIASWVKGLAHSLTQLMSRPMEAACVPVM
ncbi:hypothetical protein G6011_11786 [Alternaria panax]|uniref:Uncharacterized protein n=1 Tax=Alternaria panax TaxID=48097 RepID=A0AAD4F8E0_9PLEO|nr:hypothetical protein G6011_11786 [Alternaria panax]